MADLFRNKNLKPMLLKEVAYPFDDQEYLYEFKFDGIRTIIYVSPNEITIQSRNGNMTNLQYPELESLKKLVQKKCIFDGEIVILDQGSPNFEKLQERIMLKNQYKINELQITSPVTFICFDILYEGKSLLNMPLIQRKEILMNYSDTNYFVKTRYIKTKGKDLFEICKKNNLEGIVAKKIDSLYYPNERSSEWLKIKNVQDADFYIGGFKDNPDTNVASLALGIFDNNQFKFVGKVTIAKKKAEYEIIKKEKITKNYFMDFNDNQYHYLKPILICTIIYLQKTKQGHLRHPVFKCLKNHNKN